ncbi:alpha-1,3-mannosyl-glycoprotein 4-beta-N-acetylglucosaminyltransferase B-like [Trichomycterus rosablanca]|uniref:alpha-1,3-mannosyl-glycoprotein 4-beta-N-acetylglucosaminyltransferase B-like n=1 Tax=Trichomycterus rosablanca TaxID=2290929 RepID=UPI002F357105
MRCHDRFVVLTCLLCGGFLVLTSWYTTSWYTTEQEGLDQFQDLYMRLMIAEQHGEVVSHKLLQLLKNITVTTNSTTDNPLGKSTQTSMNINPYIYFIICALLYLPHLGEHRDSLEPNIHLGQGRTGVSLVLGVPTVQRPKDSYLMTTLSSLVYDLSPEQRADLIIIVLVAETNSEFLNSVAASIQRNFPEEVKSGLIEVISPSQYYYPDFTNLKATFGDSKERVQWRTKQNLDYSFLMMYAQHKGAYYIQLEDDIVAKSGYSEAIKAYISTVRSQKWLFLEFSALGFIGKLFQASDLPTVVEFFLMFHKDKPIDWLLDHILWVKMCNPEKDFKHCNNEKAKMKRTYKPSLFQHVGLHSSLPGKVQKLKDKDFGKQPLFKPHPNPSAVLKSSLKVYQVHSLDRAYRGQDFFWALTPSKEDYILITFNRPQNVNGYLFRSGNIETNSDKFYNTTVEVLPSDVAVRETGEKGLLQCCRHSSDGFVVVGSFLNGIAKGQIAPELHKVAAMRMTVHSNLESWVILSELFIEIQIRKRRSKGLQTPVG